MRRSAVRLQDNTLPAQPDQDIRGQSDIDIINYYYHIITIRRTMQIRTIKAIADGTKSEENTQDKIS